MEDNTSEAMQSEAAADSVGKTSEPQESAELISYDDFQKIELRVAQILAAEPVPKSEKLVRLEITLGEELGRRQIVAGIAKHYRPDELIGRKIVVVANLKPARLMGHESRGMLLAASDESGSLELLSVGEGIPSGSVVR